MAYAQYFQGSFESLLPSSCVTDLTAPTFAGISGLIANSDGSLTASWSAATDATTPIRYEVYVQALTSSGLFNSSNIQQIVTGTSARIFTDANLVYLANQVNYFVGVRARDSIGNLNTNTVSDSEISIGVLAGTIQYVSHVSFALNNSNQLILTGWLTANGVPVKTSLGTASLEVRDASDTIIGAFNQSGISANADGAFVFTPVSATTLDAFTLYRVKIAILYQSISYESSRGLTVWE